MKLKTSIRGHVYVFGSLKEVFGKSNEKRSGDDLAGVGASHLKERIAAKAVLADLLLSDIRNHPLLSAEEDEVSRMIEESIDEAVYASISQWSVAELREYIPADGNNGR